MKKRGGILIVILIVILAFVLIYLLLRLDLFKKEKPENSDIFNKSDSEDLIENVSENPSEENKTNMTNDIKINSGSFGGGGSGGGGSGGDTNPPTTPIPCESLNCVEGYVCENSFCVVDEEICNLAEDNGLCRGLDIAYEAGYQGACCLKGVCC